MGLTIEVPINDISEDIFLLLEAGGFKCCSAEWSVVDRIVLKDKGTVFVSLSKVI